MPPSDEPDRDRAKENDRGIDRKQKAPVASAKSKDLSHVPCKFFKVGGCTAGPSCPFSHTLPEPGQKEHCAWFIKGNCKFGHKCALAHVLPGQDLSMDRKNKKAAQQAAAALGGGGGGGGGGHGGGHVGGKDRKPTSKRDAGAHVDRPQGAKNSLLAGGSTAPTRLLNQPSAAGRPPMSLPLKASISPSAPAPPLNDTDFSSFASLDEMEGVAGDSISDSNTNHSAARPSGSPSPLPLSAPRNSASAAPVQNDFGPIGSPPNARSPMAEQRSPTRLNGNGSTSPRTPSHLNGINVSASPGSTTAAGILSSSPFSAPGTQTSFYPSSYSASLGVAGGVAASLGSGLAMMGGGRKGGWGGSGLSASVTRAEYDVTFEYDEQVGAKNLRKIPRGNAVDEEMEDFIPGSLTDLLTPEERSRRMSRSNSGQPPVGLTAVANTLKAETPGPGPGLGHRHSRSVPAPSLLGDLKSIWADTSGGLPSSPGNHNQQQHQATHRGTPSNSGFTARFEGLGLGGTVDDSNLSMSFGSPSSIGIISPSNASAAFLPGFHQHYLSSKAKQQQALGHQQSTSGLGRGLRNASNPLLSSTTATGTTSGNGNSLANTYMGGAGTGLGLPSSVNTNSTLHTHVHGNTAHTYRTTPSPFDLTQNIRPIRVAGNGGKAGNGNGNGAGNGTYGAANGGGKGGVGGVLDGPDLLGAPHALSPGTTRALQSHAPGQSLPQGLAAGLSRIHALPPLANIISPPGSSGPFGGASPGASAGPLASNAAYGTEWGSPASSMLTQQRQQHQQQQQYQHHQHQYQHQQQQHGGPPGLPELPTKLSYSAAAAAASRPGNNTTPIVPPGISRNAVNVPLGGAGGYQRGAHDDDELFSMEE